MCSCRSVLLLFLLAPGPFLLAQIAPTVTVPPASQHAASGSTVSFSVTASGTEPLSYQWYRFLTPISGATGRTLTLPAVTSTDNTAFTVRVSNPVGTATSQQANLTVIALENTAPVARSIGTSADQIPGAPAPVPASGGYTATVGTRFFLSATFSGAVPLQFQWTRDGVPLPGQTTPTLALANAQVTDSGVYRATATNARGTATSTPLPLTIAPYNLPPFIETQPTSHRGTVGLPAAFQVVALGETPFSYEWQRNGVAIPGATSAVLSFTSAGAADSGSYRVRVANRHGATLSNQVTLDVNVPAAAPTITIEPADTIARAGLRVVLSVAAGGTQPISYQWLRNGTAIPGAVQPELVFPAVALADSGIYTAVASNAVGSSTSRPAVLSVLPFTRISNLSVLTTLSDAADTFTVGYIVGGSGTSGPKPVILRAAGPSLTPLGVSGVVRDPRLETFAGAVRTGENDDWGGGPALIGAFASVGAFPFANPASKDAAVSAALTTRDNSLKISSADGSSGAVIAEVYDATPPAMFTAETPRLLNVSVLKSVGSGLTVGFTISGGGGRNVLVRAIGPTLADFGVEGALANPQLMLLPAGATQPFAVNDDWGGHPNLAALFATAGAFALPPGSKDAALAATLTPGGWTVVVTGVGGTTGITLVEVYEVP